MIRRGAILAALALVVLGCGGGGTRGGPSATSGGGGAASPVLTALAPSASPTATATLATGTPVPTAAGPAPTGNGLLASAPPDEPAAIRDLTAVPSCGLIVSFEVDPDASPRPTVPADVTSAARTGGAKDCLMTAWQQHRAAQLVTQETTDEQDEIYTIYRLPGDGTLDLIVRLHSHTEQTVTWNESHCRDLTLQDGQITPVDCDVEVPVH